MVPSWAWLIACQAQSSRWNRTEFWKVQSVHTELLVVRTLTRARATSVHKQKLGLFKIVHQNTLMLGKKLLFSPHLVNIKNVDDFLWIFLSISQPQLKLSVQNRTILSSYSHWISGQILLCTLNLSWSVIKPESTFFLSKTLTIQWDLKCNPCKAIHVAQEIILGYFIWCRNPLGFTTAAVPTSS